MKLPRLLVAVAALAVLLPDARVAAGPLGNLQSPAVHPRAVVVDAVTLAPIGGATVAVDGLLGQAVAESDTSGRVTLAGIALPPPPSVEDDPGALLLFNAYASGYVPLARRLELNAVGPDVVLQMVPENAGVLTPLISASQGARLQLPGIGSLKVPPGALSQDAHLRIIDMPPTTWSPSALTADTVYQVWLQTEDSLGHTVPALAPGFSGVELTVEVVRVAQLASGEEYLWRARALNASGAESGILAATAQPGTTVVTFGVTSGITQLDFEKGGAAIAGECNWSPWRLTTTALSSSLAGGVTVSVNCGIYANYADVTVSAGETKTTEHTFTGSVTGSVGWDAGVLFAKASAALSVTVSGSFASGTATTVQVASSKSTPPSGTVNGQDQSTLTTPWSCIAGTATYGVKLTTYRVGASRTCTLPNGNIQSEWVSLGNLTVPGQIIIQWNATIDANCAPGCATATLPPMPE